MIPSESWCTGGRQTQQIVASIDAGVWSRAGPRQARSQPSTLDRVTQHLPHTYHPALTSNTINPTITQVQGLLDLTRPVLVVWVEMVVVVVTQSGCPGQYPVLVFTGRGRGQAGASHRHLSTNTQTLTVRPVRSVNTTLQCIQIRLNIQIFSSIPQKFAFLLNIPSSLN